MDAPTEVGFGPLLAGGIALLLLAAGALVLFVVVYQRRLLRQQLAQQAAEAAYQQQLLAAVIASQEAERERIGRDLHDGIGSTIATAKLLVNRLERQPPAAEAAGLLTMVKEIIGAAVLDVRSVSHDLYPAVLDRYGLAEALQHLVDVSNETGALTVTLALDYPHPLPQPEELALYRIGQELVHNALKHAKGATALHVSLLESAGQLTLTVQDDGCGFVPPAAEGETSLPGPLPAGGGVGLRSIAVRVRLLRGQLRQHSAPGQGTRTSIMVRR